jgi:metallo-beta-lactamase class B
MKVNFCSMALVGAACVGAGLVVTAATGQSGGDSAEAHIEAARRAAGPEYLPVFNGLCRSLTPQPAPQPAPAVKPAPASSADPPPRAQWHVEPMKVFDNLYYLGQSEYTAWAITTSAGIIVTDPLFEYSVEDEVVNGLTKLGLDPRQIKYVLVSHGHRDHVGGAKLLQDRYGARVVMSGADWDLVLDNKQTYPKPKRDMVAVDGQQLTLGDTSITMYLTPGHTPGTISTLIPVKDHGRPHIAAQWGGTGFNFTITPEHAKPYWFDTSPDRRLASAMSCQRAAPTCKSPIIRTRMAQQRSWPRSRTESLVNRIPSSSATPTSCAT